MKCAIVVGDGVKQIMFTPETKNESNALKMITAEDDISVEMKTGTFYQGYGYDSNSLKSYNVALCQGGYLRAYKDEDSLMLVLTPKKVVKGVE